MMTNAEVLGIYQNRSILKGLSGFKLAKAIVLNMKKIEDELITVVQELTKDKPKEEVDTIVEGILAKENEIIFITLSDEDIPGDVTVEQYSVLSQFIK